MGTLFKKQPTTSYEKSASLLGNEIPQNVDYFVNYTKGSETSLDLKFVSSYNPNVFYDFVPQKIVNLTQTGNYRITVPASMHNVVEVKCNGAPNVTSFVNVYAQLA